MSSTTDSQAVSIVIPAFDEMENLRKLLPEMQGVMRSSRWPQFEMVVVLPMNAPQSDVAEVVDLGGNPVRRGPSDSFGDALRSGFEAVSDRSTWVIVMDADGSHSASTIPRLLEASPAADVVVASRYVHGGRTDNSLILRMMSRSLNFGYRLILGIPCKDISTNFKRYRGDDIRTITLVCRDFDIVEEIFFRIKTQHGATFAVLEIPDHFMERASGTTKRKLGPFVVSYLGTLWRLKRQAMSNRP